MTFSKQFPKTITTTNTFIPDEPDFSVTNPLKKDIFCNGVEIVCSPEFTRKGAVVIKVDGITQFDSRNSGGFQRVGKLPVTLNTRMKRDVIVDVFVFNETDTNEISCTVTVFLSEESKNLDSSLQYISDDVVNSLVSDFETIFIKALRGNVNFSNPQIETSLIDMRGYSNLSIILTYHYDEDILHGISASNNAPITSTFTNKFAVDGDFFSFLPKSTIDNTPVILFDFKTIAFRPLKIAYLIKKGTSFNALVTQVEISDNGTDWTNIANNVGISNLFEHPTDDIKIRFDGSAGKSFRYVRLTFDTGNSDYINNFIGLLEVYDSSKTYGVAKLDFEIKNSDGVWVISSGLDSDSTGLIFPTTISNTGLVGSIKNQILTSSKNLFRIKLTVTGAMTLTLDVIRES